MSETATRAGEPPDPDGLPAWSQADLPEAPPLNLRNAFRMVGPGIIAMGLALGAGEWLFGPVVTVRYQGRLMFVVVLVSYSAVPGSQIVPPMKRSESASRL